eukprot:s172_g17.t2
MVLIPPRAAPSKNSEAQPTLATPDQKEAADGAKVAGVQGSPGDGVDGNWESHVEWGRMKPRVSWQVVRLFLISSSLELVEGTVRFSGSPTTVHNRSAAECEGDSQELLQHQKLQAAPDSDLIVDIIGRGHGPERWPEEEEEPDPDSDDAIEVDSCQAASWPCYDNVACHWPLQQINVADRDACSGGTGYANISSLNLDDGSYTTLCQLEGVCLNACSVSPIHSAIFCRAQGAFSGQQFVRISCPLGDLSEIPVKGSLCYYGQIGSTYAGSFDLEFGTYYWKEILDKKIGVINKLDADSISGFSGSATALVKPTTGWDQVKNAQVNVVNQAALKSIADFVIAAGEEIPGGKATDRFLVGCHSNRVYVQNVNFTGTAPATQSYLMEGSNPQGGSGAQWFFKGEIYCAYNDKKYGVYFVNVSAIADGKIPAGFVSRSQETKSNDGMNCLNATSPFPPAIITTTSTTTVTTTTPIPQVRCTRGQGDWSLGDASGGSLQVGKEISPGVTLVEFRPGGNEECTNAAIFTPENGGDGEDESDLKKCVCNLIVAQKDGLDIKTNSTVNVCSPTTARAEVVLQFDVPQRIRGFEMWNTRPANMTTQFRWENENQMKSGVMTAPTSERGTSSGFVDISTIEPLATNVKKVSIDFGGPAGLKSIRFCKQDGSVVGDPHVHTLDGKSYVLLQQGTFLMWRLSGFETEFPSSNVEQGNKKAEVDWRIFVHYSGHRSYTKGLLLLDNSMGVQRQALELTSENCDQPQMLSVPTDESEFVTGFNVQWKEEEMQLLRHVRFEMNTLHGSRVVATLHASCRPGHHINTRIDMDQFGYSKYVQGEVGLARARPLPELHHRGNANTVDLLSNVGTEGIAVRTDEQFKAKFDWHELGGSHLAADYLSTVDEEGLGQVTPCDADEEINAREICQFIEAQVFDDGGKSQGTVFLEVKRLYGTGSSGRMILCDYVTASDEYYRYWVSTEDGVTTTVDGNYHLCRGDPTSCVGGGAGQVVHLGKWRVWSEKELIEGEASHLDAAAADEMLKYFKQDKGEARSSRPGALPWEDTPMRIGGDRKKKDEERAKEGEKEDPKNKKQQRIARLQKELEALKASVEDEEEEGKKKKRKKKEAPKGKTNPEEDRARKAFRGAEMKMVPKRGHEDEDDSSSYGMTDETSSEKGLDKKERKELRRLKAKAKEARGKREERRAPRRDDSRGKKKRKKKGVGAEHKGKDRGPFGVAPSEDWATRRERTGESSEEESRSSGESSFRKAPSSKSHHLRLVRYAKRYPGRLAARLLKRMESATGFGGGAETKTFQHKGDLQPVAHMYYLAVMTPHMREKWTPRTQRELKVNATLLDLMVRGQGPEAADILAQRIKALEKSVSDGNQWRRARHLELVEPEDVALVDQGEEDMMLREAEREDKVRLGSRWNEEKGSWRKGAGKTYQPGDGRRKGQEGAKGKGKKGNPLDKAPGKKEETPV